MIDPNDFLCFNSHKFSNQKIRYAPQGTKDAIVKETSFFPGETPLLVRLIALRDGFSFDNPPRCESCGVMLNRTTGGKLLRFCGSKCYSASDQFKNSLKNVDHQKANEVRRKTMKNKYGVEFNSQRDEVKPILQKSKLEGVNDYALKILQSKELMEDLHINQKKSSLTISKELNVYYGTVKDWIEKHGIVYQFYPHESQYERLVQSWLSDLKVEFIQNDRIEIYPKELDIWIPTKRTAIEINGYFWHGAKNKVELLDARKRHQEKTIQCRKKDISLIHFSDIDLKKHQDQIKQFLKFKLTEQPKIGARECELRTLSITEAKEFCDEYHLQGYTGANLKFGLFLKDELVSIMTFSKSRFNQDVWEIVRACSKYNVVGGVSKFLAYFKTNHMNSGDRLLTYVNLNNGFSGVSYEKAGMVFEKMTDPGYIWIDKGEQVFSRYQMQPKKIKSLFPDYAGEKEDDFLFDKNMIKLFDSGNLVYSLKKD